MNGLYFGANVDGGTFPAQIWGDYMKQAKRGYCGEFKRPDHPFQASPFYGKYSRTGAKGTVETDAPATNAPAPTGGSEPTYDPDLYESPPQDAPSSPEPEPQEAPDGAGDDGKADVESAPGGQSPPTGGGAAPDGE